MEAIQTAQSIALSAQNMNIEQIHLFLALVKQENGLIGQLMKKLNVDVNALTNALQKTIDGMPAVTGSGRQPGSIYVARDVDTALNDAEQKASQMKDEYVSVEHICLALLEKPNSTLQKVLNQYHIDKDAFLQALLQVRGRCKSHQRKPRGNL